MGPLDGACENDSTPLLSILKCRYLSETHRLLVALKGRLRVSHPQYSSAVNSNLAFCLPKFTRVGVDYREFMELFTNCLCRVLVMACKIFELQHVGI